MPLTGVADTPEGLVFCIRSLATEKKTTRRYIEKEKQKRGVALLYEILLDIRCNKSKNSWNGVKPQ